MKTLFFGARGEVVWTCTENAKYELNNGSRAIRMGAVKGILYDANDKEIDQLEYPQF